MRKEGLNPEISLWFQLYRVQRSLKRREELSVVNGLQDVGLVLTTRELARIIKAFGIDLPALPDSDYCQSAGYFPQDRQYSLAPRRCDEVAGTVADILTGQSSDSI